MDVKKCSNCKLFFSKSDFHKYITKTKDTNLLVLVAQINIIMIIKIKFMTIIKFILKTIEGK